MRVTILAAGAAILSLAAFPALAAPGKHNPAAKLSLTNAKAPAEPQTDAADAAETPSEGSGGPSARTLLIAGAIGAAVVVGAVALGDNDDEVPASM